MLCLFKPFNDFLAKRDALHESSAELPFSVKPAEVNTVAPLGVSMNFIRGFLKDRPSIALNAMTISQINEVFVKPESAGTDQSYLYKFVGQLDEHGKLLVAPSTIFISYAWAYKFVDVVVNVMKQCSEEDKNCYFWFDLFTNDQNNVVDKVCGIQQIKTTSLFGGVHIHPFGVM